MEVGVTWIVGLFALLHVTDGAVTAWTKPNILTGSGAGTFLTGIREDATANTAVGTVVATSSGTILSYAITGQQASTPLFIITTAGELQLSSATLDYEVATSYWVVVEARDDDSSTGTATITINILDANDKIPVVTEDTPSGVAIDDQSAGGTVLTTVKATDDDGTSPNNVVLFSITGGNTGNDFTIGSTSGIITVAGSKTISHARTPSYTLEVTVTDGGTPAKTTTHAITVTVREAVTATIKWTNPAINTADGSGTSSGVIPESTAPGTATSVRIQATDATSYEILNQPIADKLSIGADGTVTMTTGTFDYEVTPTYVITVKAVDVNGNSGTAMVTINIGDINDNAPTFPQSTKGVHINNAATAGTALTTITAVDNDGTEANNQVSYSIIGGNTNDDFAINDTGSITVAADKTLSASMTAGYGLRVKAVDSGTSPMSGEMTVFVLILDTDFLWNWTNPEIESADGSGVAIGVIPENWQIGTATPVKLAAATATWYRIVDQPVAGMFNINNEGDVMLASGQLDYETDKSYVLVVEAKTCIDNSGTATVTINIGDVNDNPPVFSKTTYGAAILHESGEGTEVLQLSTTDADDTPENKDVISFTITDGNTDNDFTIDNTGLITVAPGKSVSSDHIAGYGLTVEAVDAGSPAQTGTVAVYIVVGSYVDKDTSAAVLNMPSLFWMVSIVLLSVSFNRRM